MEFADLVLQSPIIRSRHDLFAAARSSQAPLRHQTAPGEQLVRGNAMSARHQAHRHARLAGLRHHANLLRSRPAAPALNRRDDLNALRRVGHRHGCMPHTCQVGDRVRSVRGLSQSFSSRWLQSVRLGYRSSTGGEQIMPAYLIAEHKITDPIKFDEYRTKVGPMLAKHGGRYLTKGGSHKFPEGGHWKPERVVIIEFPDMDALNDWYNSSEYQPLIALRRECTSDMDMLITLEGASNNSVFVA